MTDRLLRPRGGGGARVLEGDNHPFLKGKALGTKFGGRVQFSKRLDFARGVNFENAQNVRGVEILLSNSKNRERLKIFRNVDRVLANHNKVQDRQANLKTTN